MMESMLAVDERMSEFCGVIMGDGNLWTNGRKYEITITGSPKDKPYMDCIAEYAKTIKPRIYYRQRGRGLRLTIYSKILFHFLIHDIGFKHGSEKGDGNIPRIIARRKDLSLAFIRGFFDTDGSIFTSNKKGAENYPTLEITNENLALLSSIQKILENEGIRTTFRKSNTNTYKIAVHGKEMIGKWMHKIGSSHPRKRSKMESIIKTSVA
jgi:intein-encoded DNA endonuclease-like protein